MMYIFEVNEGEDVALLPEATQLAIQATGAQWPESRMIGTEPVNGRQLVFVWANASITELDELILEHALDWTVNASEEETVKPAWLLDFFSDVPTFDEDGNVTGSEPVTDLTGKMQTFSGHHWTY